MEGRWHIIGERNVVRWKTGIGKAKIGRILEVWWKGKDNLKEGDIK